VSAASLLKYVYLASFSQPKAERLLYRAIRRQKIRKVVELGVGSCSRAIRLIQVAQRYAGTEQVHYTGIDLFEARGDGPALLLKSAFQLLKPTGARVQLIPGDPKSALSRAANSLVGTELIIISQDQNRESLARAWFYVPRMLAAGALVYREEVVADGVIVLRPTSRADIERLAASGSTPMGRAA
jgi:hypothetical protein